MSRLSKLTDADIPEEAKPFFEFAKEMMGFTPNDAYDMARNPGILKGVAAMCGAIYAPGEINQGFKRLIGHIASTAAGCKYCQIHTAHGAHEKGEEDVRILAAWEYETSDLFTEAERTALRVAQAGGMNPGEVSDELFSGMKTYYSEAQIIEIVAVISMFGFLNRWNSIMGTKIEETPMSFIENIGMSP